MKEKSFKNLSIIYMQLWIGKLYNKSIKYYQMKLSIISNIPLKLIYFKILRFFRIGSQKKWLCNPRQTEVLENQMIKK